MAKTTLDERDDGRLMTSPGAVENRREIFIQGIFIRRDTAGTTAAVMLLLLQKRELCRLEVNCVVKCSYFLRIEDEVRDGRG
jgi:hypothetical protein